MDLDRMKRHIGVLTNTGVRCIVVFRKVPDDDKNCLVVETDRLPDMYHDNVIDAVNSREAQQTVDFFEILNRRVLSDGTNALQSLHYKQFLRKVPIDQVSLVPFPGQLLPLALLNAQHDGNMDEYEATQAQVKAAELAANPTVDPNNPVALAEKLLLDAELLDAEAVNKRNEAYELDPGLVAEAAPKVGRPKLTDEEREARKLATKVKRKERDQKKAAEKKKAKSDATLDAKVDAKVLRDAEKAD